MASTSKPGRFCCCFPQPDEPISIRDAIASFGKLSTAPRELWIVYFLKFLESYAYFSVSYVLVLYLSAEFGYSDESAGWAYGFIGLLTSLYGTLSGFVVDNLGVKWCMALGVFVLLAARILFALTTSPVGLAVTLYLLFPLGQAFGIPVMSIGIRRYTNDSNRAVGFSLFYVVMNVGALVSAPAVDIFREKFKEGVHVSFFHWQTHLSAYRILILSGAVVTMMMLVVVLFCVRELDVDDTGEIKTFKPKSESPWTILRQVTGQKRFWRFVLFILLLIGVRTIFRHLDATFPKYMVREVGADAPYGTIIGINPLIVIFLVPVVTAFSTHVSAFNLILVGSWISSLSVFVLCIGPYISTAIIFVILLSIGEAIWSPRLYEYCTMIAPTGREGTYGALASAPMFVATLLVGGLSGNLIAEYVPEHGPRNSRMMWFIVGAVTISSPILICLLKSTIEAEDEDEVDPVSAKNEAVNHQRESVPLLTESVVSDNDDLPPRGGGGAHV
eukprot:GFYU01028312.1.p1 GENE.GFYU01028312.1~~GFYU01028312.1.p1  ORF type:complete len:501 (-),score=125.29 GFYU01028312.1:126-1628(-)